jgi:hypothetical protein
MNLPRLTGDFSDVTGFILVLNGADIKIWKIGRINRNLLSQFAYLWGLIVISDAARFNTRG